MNNESRYEGHMNRARQCGAKIDQIDGNHVLLPHDMDAKELVSMDLSHRHQSKFLAGIVLEAYRDDGISRIINARPKARPE